MPPVLEHDQQQQQSEIQVRTRPMPGRSRGSSFARRVLGEVLASDPGPGSPQEERLLETGVRSDDVGGGADRNSSSSAPGLDPEPEPEPQLREPGQIMGGGGSAAAAVAAGTPFVRVHVHRVGTADVQDRILALYSQFAKSEKMRKPPAVLSIEAGPCASGDREQDEDQIRDQDHAGGARHVAAVVRFASEDGELDPRWKMFWRQVADLAEADIQVVRFSPVRIMRPTAGIGGDDEEGANWVRKMRRWLLD